jgi:hypothetical protein
MSHEAADDGNFFVAGEAFDQLAAQAEKGLRTGCLVLAIATLAGGSLLAGSLITLERTGVHARPGVVPLSVQIEVVGPCSRETLGGTRYPWEQVIVSKTVGINVQQWEAWVVDGEKGYRTCEK